MDNLLAFSAFLLTVSVLSCYPHIGIFTHLKLWLAIARHSFKWVKITANHLHKYHLQSLWRTEKVKQFRYKGWTWTRHVKKTNLFVLSAINGKFVGQKSNAVTCREKTKTVTAHLKSKQLLPSGFARHRTSESGEFSSGGGGGSFLESMSRIMIRIRSVQPDRLPDRGTTSCWMRAAFKDLAHDLLYLSAISLDLPSPPSQLRQSLSRQ